MAHLNSLDTHTRAPAREGARARMRIVLRITQANERYVNLSKITAASKLTPILSGGKLRSCNSPSSSQDRGYVVLIRRQCLRDRCDVIILAQNMSVDRPVANNVTDRARQLKW